MPNISTNKQLLHNALDPYHVDYDNLPLKNLMAVLNTVNQQVDINAKVLRDSIGTAGNLSVRLNQSLLPNGDLQPNAVDKADHNIAAHADGSATLTNQDLTIIGDLGYSVTNPVEFVRMLSAERAKLSGIANSATAFALRFDTDTFSGLTEIQDSDTVTWEVISPNKLQAHMAFDSESAHKHYYDQNATSNTANTADANYNKIYKTGSPYPYVEGSLRVYVNGIRVTSDTNGVYVPKSNGPEDDWRLVYFSETDAASGTFTFNRKMEVDDLIKVDYEIRTV